MKDFNKKDRTLSKSWMISVLIIFIVVVSHAQPVLMDSPYFQLSFKKKAPQIIYGDTNNYGLMISLSKFYRIKTIESYENGQKNGLSYYYKRKKLDYFKNYLNNQAVDYKKVTLESIRLFYNIDSSYNWYISVNYEVGFGTLILIREDNNKIQRSMIFKKNKLVSIQEFNSSNELKIKYYKRRNEFENIIL